MINLSAKDLLGRFLYAVIGFGLGVIVLSDYLSSILNSGAIPK